MTAGSVRRHLKIVGRVVTVLSAYQPAARQVATLPFPRRGQAGDGSRLDSKTNARPTLEEDISTADSRVRVLVIRAEEDWAILAECWKLAHVAAHVGSRN